MKSDHALVPRDGYMVPLIGIKPEAALEECDVCHEQLPTGKQMLCKKCNRKRDK